MYFKRIFILLGIFVLLVNCTSKPEPDVLATLNSNELTILDFFKENAKNVFLKQPEKTKKQTIQQWIDNKVLLLEAEKSTLLEEDSKLKKQLESFKKDLQIRQYLDRTILDSVVTNDFLQDLYKKSVIQVKASHILLGYNKINKDVSRTKNEAKILAQKIVTLLKTGTNFETLAKKYSDDKGSAETGDLGFFDWGKMVGPFQEAAFNMKPGDISDPIETQFGFHVIKVTDIKHKKTNSFDEEKPKLVQQGIRERRDILQATYLARVNKLKVDYNFKLNDENMNIVIQEYEKIKLQLAETKQEKISPSIILQKIDLDLKIAEYDNKKIGIELLIDEVKKNPRIGENFTKQEIMGKIIENVVIMDIFSKEFLKSGLDTNEEYLESIKNNRNNALIKKYKNTKISESTKITDADIQKYYEDNKDIEYMIPEKSEVSEIYCENKDSAEQILEKVLLDKENFQSYADEHTKRYNTKPRKGYLGFISEKQYVSIGKTAATMEKNFIHPNV